MRQETALVFEIPNKIKEENFIMAPGQEITPISILNDEFCEKQAFPHLFLKDKFDYNTA